MKKNFRDGFRGQKIAVRESDDAGNRHVGRNRIYIKFYARVYRTKCPELVDGVLRKYRREPMAKVGPYFAKTRAEFQKYLFQFAKANLGMGRFDWSFEIEDRGAVQVKTREDVGRENQEAPAAGHLSREIFKP